MLFYKMPAKKLNNFTTGEYEIYVSVYVCACVCV